MSNSSDERVLWTDAEWQCVMVSCCAGAELQLRKVVPPDFEIVLRELYPTKSDLYERSRALEIEYRAAAQVRAPEEDHAPTPTSAGEAGRSGRQ